MGSSSHPQRLFVFSPTFVPHGGVIKIFDYACHAVSLGLDVTICCNEAYSPGVPLFQIDRFQKLAPDRGIRYLPPGQVPLTEDDLVFLSWPPDFEFVRNRIALTRRYENVIHIMQSVRHANRSFLNGYATDLLRLPFSRIAVTHQVHDAIKPFLSANSLTRAIILGHDTEFFHRTRHEPFHSPLRVAYTAWKSKIGDRIAGELRDRENEFAFRSLADQVSWPELRQLYHWADVFLATPNSTEGFYLPGLEAMSAGAVVVTPDAVGNRAYCNFGNNCLLVRHEDVESYVTALESLQRMPEDEVAAIRNRAHATADRHQLSTERNAFGDFLQALRQLDSASQS
jgi:glycosyltransferase involved in cell wall biosynthesis